MKFPKAIGFSLNNGWKYILIDVTCFSQTLSSPAGKESTCNAGDPSSIPGSGRSPGEGIDYPFQCSWASLVAQLVKNLPAMQETWVQFLGWEDPLEKGKATHSSILAWRIPWTVHGVTKSRTWLSNWTELSEEDQNLVHKSSNRGRRAVEGFLYSSNRTSFACSKNHAHPPDNQAAEGGLIRRGRD